MVTKPAARAAAVPSPVPAPARAAEREAVDRPAAGGRKRGISRAEAAQIALQLGIMLEAGVPLSQALESLQVQADRPHVREAMQAILADVRNGSDLSTAIARCPYRFPAVFSRLLRAAEASGAMGTMLHRTAEYLQSEVEAVRKLRGAMAYPVIMMVLAMAAMVLIFCFLLPRFEVMYAGRQAMLPWPTKVALGISHLLRGHWMVISVAGAATIGAAAIYLRSARGRITLDWVKLHCPLISRMFRQFYVSRSFQTMGTMIAAGVTVPEAVRLSRDVAGNHYFVELWDQAEANLQAGQRLADPLFASRLVSHTVSQMVATGERSGNLAVVMQRIAAVSETELQHTIKMVTGMLEPIMIIVLGGVVGSIVMAILLPIFRITRLMGGGG